MVMGNMIDEHANAGLLVQSALFRVRHGHHADVIKENNEIKL